MKKLCCIEKLEKKLSEINDGKPVELELSSYVETGDEQAATFETVLDYTPVFYRVKEGKKWVKRHVPLNFCPICGKKK